MGSLYHGCKGFGEDLIFAIRVAIKSIPHLLEAISKSSIRSMAKISGDIVNFLRFFFEGSNRARATLMPSDQIMQNPVQTAMQFIGNHNMGTPVIFCR
jgi:hypothetical protein